MDILKYLLPNNWTRLSNESLDDTDNRRRDILFSQIMIVGILISLSHFINDLISGNKAAYLIDFIFVAILVCFYVLNEKGYHRLAKILDMTMLSLLVFGLSGILDERIRMVYNFFPLAILAFIIFYKTELFYNVLFLASEPVCKCGTK